MRLYGLEIFVQVWAVLYKLQFTIRAAKAIISRTIHDSYTFFLLFNFHSLHYCTRMVNIESKSPSVKKTTVALFLAIRFLFVMAAQGFASWSVAGSMAVRTDGDVSDMLTENRV